MYLNDLTDAQKSIYKEQFSWTIGVANMIFSHT